MPSNLAWSDIMPFGATFQIVQQASFSLSLLPFCSHQSWLWDFLPFGAALQPAFLPIILALSAFHAFQSCLPIWSFGPAGGCQQGSVFLPISFAFHAFQSCLSIWPFGPLQEAARRAHERLAAEENRELMMAKAQRHQEEEQYAKDVTRMEQQTEVLAIKPCCVKVQHFYCHRALWCKHIDTLMVASVVTYYKGYRQLTVKLTVQYCINREPNLSQKCVIAHRQRAWPTVPPPPRPPHLPCCLPHPSLHLRLFFSR